MTPQNKNMIVNFIEEIEIGDVVSPSNLSVLIPKLEKMLEAKDRQFEEALPKMLDKTKGICWSDLIWKCKYREMSVSELEEKILKALQAKDRQFEEALPKRSDGENIFPKGLVDIGQEAWNACLDQIKTNYYKK